MVHSFYHKLGRVLWVAVVLLLVLMAVYVSVGRLLVSSLGYYREDILQELNLRVPFNVQADQVTGQWRSFSPVIVLSGLSLTLPESPGLPLQLTEGQARIDVWSSLRTRSLQVSKLRLEGLTLQGEYTAEGGFRLRGMSTGDGSMGAWIEELLLNLKEVKLRDNLLRVSLPGGEVRDLDLQLSLSRLGSSRRLEGKLQTTRGVDITVLAKGLGNPFEPESFSGDLYVEVASSDLGAARDLMPGRAPPMWAEGELEFELWLAWDKGRTEVETSVRANDLVIAPDNGAWQIPLDSLDLEAQMSEERGTWTVHAQDVALTSNGVLVSLPQAQLDVWRDSLRLRAVDIKLGPLMELISEIDAIPENLRGVFTELAPVGKVSALQVSLGDVRRPADEWEVEANFDSLQVQPFKGAPGVEGGRGYLQLNPGHGELLLDSRNFALVFPKLYLQPLGFDELYGTLYLDWDSSAVTLSSGQISAQGEEGSISAFFGLNIPLQDNDIGIEMDLLVGLRDSQPKYRFKYVPFVLNETLRQWLDSSIGHGDVIDGGFLWRGALQSGRDALRTVQLAFNIEDTTLEYHPDWPPVVIEAGVAYIDDSRVSVWADEAVLLDSAAVDLSVETEIDASKRVLLHVATELEGPAKDVLNVVNNSPLDDVVNGAFGDWSITGELDSQLRLGMVLGKDAPAPDVKVRTEWIDVQLGINPGGIAVNNLQGTLSYSSVAGFSSTDLVGEFWGEEAHVELLQHHDRGTKYDPATSMLQVRARTRADMSDLQQWLQLDMLAMAQGKSAIDLSVNVASGSPPALVVYSDLKGIALDLPQPWRKPADESRSFSLSMDLASTPRRLAMALDDDLRLQLNFDGRQFLSGGLGLATAAPQAQQAEFYITGRPSRVDAAQLYSFIADYLMPEAAVDTAGGMPAGTQNTVASTVEAPLPDGAEDVPARIPVSVRVDDLQVDQLLLGGVVVADVGVEMTMRDDTISASAQTSWLRGTMLWPLAGDNANVVVDYLDVNALQELEPLESDEESTDAMGELRLVDVTLANIHQGDKRFGDLAFDVSVAEGQLTASSITGKLAGLAMTPEQPGTLRWQTGEDVSTSLGATLSFDDLGTTLKYFGYEQIIETESGSFAIDLGWPDSPGEFSLAQAQGSIEVAMGEGSFLSAPSTAAGALRVVDILNLVDVVQRLSVRRMFDSGIPFDTVTGEVYLHGGTIEVPKLLVEGGSSFSFSAVSDVATQSLNGELVATLPVAKNLPWVAALAAGLPVAAGVYAVSKIFDKQVNRLSSAVYSIEGSWYEPEVNFSRVFDDSSPAFSTNAAILAGEVDAPAIDGDGELLFEQSKVSGDTPPDAPPAVEEASGAETESDYSTPP